MSLHQVQVLRDAMFRVHGYGIHVPNVSLENDVKLAKSVRCIQTVQIFWEFEICLSSSLSGHVVVVVVVVVVVY